MATSFPLAWPPGWPRENGRLGNGHFGSRVYGAMTFDRARRLLMDELKRLHAADVVLSTNLPLRGDGQPYADAERRKMDSGIAVYFTLKKSSMVMACDRYSGLAANMRSVGLAIEAMRTLERHGGGAMMERAFAGFAALPAPGKIDWRSVLRFKPGTPVTASDVQVNYRAIAKERHADAGGSDAAMADLNTARDAALKEISGG